MSRTPGGVYVPKSHGMNLRIWRWLQIQRGRYIGILRYIPLHTDFLCGVDDVLLGIQRLGAPGDRANHDVYAHEDRFELRCVIVLYICHANLYAAGLKSLNSATGFRAREGSDSLNPRISAPGHIYVEMAHVGTASEKSINNGSAGATRTTHNKRDGFGRHWKFWNTLRRGKHSEHSLYGMCRKDWS